MPPSPPDRPAPPSPIVPTGIKIPVLPKLPTPPGPPISAGSTDNQVPAIWGVSVSPDSPPGLVLPGSGTGVAARSGSGAAIQASSDSGPGIQATSDTGTGLQAASKTQDGIQGVSSAQPHAGVSGTNLGGGYGLLAFSDAAGGTGIYARGQEYAAQFDGNVTVSVPANSTKHTIAAETNSADQAAVFGINWGNGYGIFAQSGAAGGTAIYARGQSAATFDGKVRVFGEMKAEGPADFGGMVTVKGLHVSGRVSTEGPADFGYMVTAKGADFDGDVTSKGLHVNGNVTAKDAVTTKDLHVNGQVYGENAGFAGDVTSRSLHVRGNAYGEGAADFSCNVTVAGTVTVDQDIVLANADCAEEFDVVDSAGPGTVMVIGDDEALRPSAEAYDRRVAGVISGGGEYKPALLLDRRASSRPRSAVALVGKVCCKVDADHGPIEVGDLLTTSPRPGHAMRASDRDRAFGAVIGKALQPLDSGQGLIPILVALQ